MYGKSTHDVCVISSIQARVGSVVVLAAILDGSRQFLAAADDR